MEIIPAGIPAPFDVSFDSPALFVGLNVFDVSSGIPVAVGGVIPMVNAPGSNSYAALFTPVSGKQYLFLKRVFTDNTYTAVDPEYGTGSESAYSSAFISEISLILASLPAFTFDGGIVGIAYEDEINIGPLGDLRPIEIVKGSKATIKVRLLRKTDLSPLDLTGITEISTCFLNDDGTELMLSLTGGNIAIIGDPILGLVAITLTSEMSQDFAVDSSTALQLALEYANGDPSILKVPGAYSILANDC